MQLFTPIKIGAVELKNRIVMPSLTNHFAKDGFVMEQAVEYYSVRARGGAAMICVEDGIVEFPRGNNVNEPVAVDDDKYIPMLSRLAAAIKKNGAVPAIQLSHAGRRAGRPVNAKGEMETTRGFMPVAPSMIGHPRPGFIVPRELEISEIEELVEKFGQGARRCVEAGFEVIGLHCAHMYLCGEFLSPWANIRTDKYGGSLENRIRFVLEILARMQKEMNGIPLMMRMNGVEPPGGNTLDDIREIARRVESAGVKAISVSAGFGPVIKFRNIVSTQAPIGTPEGVLMPYAENIKAGVSIPVMVGNAIRDPQYMEQAIREGRCDIITLGRPHIADPEWVNKVKAGREEEVRPCICCCQGCQGSVMKGKPMTCILNPLVGKEADPELRITKTKDPKKVLVIGAGPAGLETALTAAARGHNVTVWEKDGQIGGTLRLAEIPPRKDVLRKVIRYFENRVKNLHLKIEYNREATEENVDAFRPDVVVVAVGGKSFVPPIKGIDSSIVHMAHDVLRNSGINAKRAVVVGGGQVGIELSEYLAERDAQITIVEMLDAVGGDMYLVT
ncbi:MAG: FAD-dependent oxidoreductase [Peptococcaceae bacterium]|jgi:2,4-dienoyl-CoA reductase-like NADH-dependent reductase (Old Yellow Enzyme family)|nr:FAD-dependent oxidoreductase [Peptococcaceae bacterium]